MLFQILSFELILSKTSKFVASVFIISIIPPSPKKKANQVPFPLFLSLIPIKTLVYITSLFSHFIYSLKKR